MIRHLSLALLVTLPLFIQPVAVVADEPAIQAHEGLPIIDWKDAGNYVGKEVIVQGRIEATGRARTIVFLNFDRARSFTAIVRKKSEGNFPSPPDAMYSGKLVQIRGRISMYKEKPQIEITHPDQVKIIDAAGETANPDQPAAASHRKFDGVVTIATYNVLNMFDAHDDPYHSDEGTPQKSREELQKLAATIHRVDADVIALEEVENRGILEDFTRAMLGDMGYQNVVCFEGNDGRGIDCAVLSRFPVGPVTSYRHLRFEDGNGGLTSFRRDLLRVRIEPPDASPFDIYAVHLKSKRGGDTSEHVRMAETKAIRRVLEDELARDAKSLFVLCGDFNDTWDSNPIKQLRGQGPMALHAFVNDIPKETATYNKAPYKSMIDFIFCSPEMAKRYVAKSLRVVDGTVESSGSDHNPVVAKFDVRSAPSAKAANAPAARDRVAVGG
ncbi:MAG: endonuclease/exonuclease/phosphatase family protein [Phycisphaerales bacterium]|nr:endonuclease/exonuclease/phosphatase family protein [Phycisphaerales bacterium]MCB9856394.1 endonuclease/exonuclease/phosphatase family protein [Phycisphaerales bacterium]MCB9864525.1 endonuclease/exonuclease/phosphatase family protein [Phycisphaerales bacterium]